eukprot:scaffold101770_cov77-Phaeocystis_antarctica.AAC.3
MSVRSAILLVGMEGSWKVRTKYGGIIRHESHDDSDGLEPPDPKLVSQSVTTTLLAGSSWTTHTLLRARRRRGAVYAR